MTLVTSSGEDISNIKTREVPPNLDAGEHTEGAREGSLISPASHITFTFNEACRARINTREMSIHAGVENTEQPQEGKYQRWSHEHSSNKNKISETCCASFVLRMGWLMIRHTTPGMSLVLGEASTPELWWNRGKR